MPSYLFQFEELAAFTHHVAPDTLFAFDLDGTLAPIVIDYGEAKVAKSVRSVLQRLMGLAKVAIITGRSRQDAIGILGFQPHLVIGNHGAEWPGRSSERRWELVQLCLKWRDRLHTALFYEPGIEIEFKGESLSLHYRKCEDPQRALVMINTAIDDLEPPPRTIGGKYVVNVVPAEAFGKGEALAAAMEELGCSRAIYFGDDETDEEVFRLARSDVFGVHVGKNDHSAATYYLNQQSEILGLLNSMVGILEAHCESESQCCDG
ncbi:trehalose-phosphatase [Geomonas sp. Red69]|uniref:Trehalose 6-phosphate phosphatase n=1 Tax=Geomonas diazotrophica TaxID=2843197 RepID=A0ABX8JG52_9BACT|nr:MULTISPECIES: trehalose-phosphatase [Geomonas]MBU5639017.1 trehalose-phosphatase [Geomonas diazotrophica]QWV96452.1 trehalose-phosphatase [Geomonas nitrogeniifigens]